MNREALQEPNKSDKQVAGADKPTNVDKQNQQLEWSPNTIAMSSTSEGKSAITLTEPAQTPKQSSGEGRTNDKTSQVGPIPVSDGPPNPSSPLKQPYIRACAFCPNCGKDMVPKGIQGNRSKLWPEWECEDHGDRNQNELTYHVRYCVGREIVTPRRRVRAPWQMTTETQKNQQDCFAREEVISKLAKNLDDYPPMSALQCRLGEMLVGTLEQNKQDVELAIKTATRFFEKFDVKTMEIAINICLSAQGKTSPSEVLEFVRNFIASKLNSTPVGLIQYAEANEWKGDKVEQISLISALLKAINFASNNMSTERRDHLLTAAYYIAGHFQPDPSVFVPPSILEDYKVKSWCLYDYAEEHKAWKLEFNMLTQLNQAAKERRESIKPTPAEPVERVEYRYKPHPTKPGAFYLAKCERARPWSYSEASSMIAEVRYLKKIMASSTLNGEAAGWCKLPGKDLVIPTGGIWGERKKEQLKQRMVTNRILETEEKQNILDESIVTDEGKGAASILWQGWGGGRKEDVEKYCLDNFVWEDGQIRTNRDQTKNESCKMVTALMNFYFMAFFLMKTGRWNAECFRNGYSSNTRKRILTKAGFWAESWADSLAIADQMPGNYFAYTAFDCTLDFPDARRLVEFLRKPTPIRDLILAGMPADHVNRILHGSLRGPGLSEIIADRLNVMMQGPLLYDPSLFPNPNHPPRDRAMYLIKMPNISPANLKCLNRWLIEDALPGLVSSRQSYPRNALRRSGITAYSLLFDDPNRAALYFSSGKKSVETIYNTPAPKKYSREHWTIGYNAISKSLGTDRAYLLPAGHKLDEFRTPEVVEMEGKISEDAATFENSEKGKPKRREGYSAQNPKYTPEERKALTAEYERRISSGEELTLAEYVKEKKMGMTTLTTMLQAVGFRQHRTEEDVRLLVEEFKEEAKRGVSIDEFASKKNLPSRTLYHYLTDAGVSSDGHTGDEVKALLEQLTQSAMTDAEFARNGGFSVATLSKWKADAAKKATGHQNGSSGDVKNGTEQKNVVVDDYQTCKKNDPDLTPMKFAKLRGIPYSSLRTLFANVGGLLANVKRHSRDEIRQIIEDYDKARDENPELTREDYALRCGITEHTLNTWLSDGFRKLVFSDDGEGPDTDSEEETEEMN